MALSDNLVAYRKMDSNSNDSVGSSNGTDTSITYTTGKIGNCAGFNGSSSKIQTPSTITGTTNATFSMWFKSSTAKKMGLITKRDSNSNGIFFWQVGADGKPCFYDYNGSAFLFAGCANTAVCDGNRHLIGFTRNGTTGTFWLDGSSNGTITCTSALSRNTMVLNIGADLVDGAYNNGYIDEVGIWTRAIDSSERTTLYNSGTGITYPFPSTANTTNFFQFIT